MGKEDIHTNNKHKKKEQVETKKKMSKEPVMILPRRRHSSIVYLWVEFPDPLRTGAVAERIGIRPEYTLFDLYHLIADHSTIHSLRTRLQSEQGILAVQCGEYNVKLAGNLNLCNGLKWPLHRGTVDLVLYDARLEEHFTEVLVAIQRWFNPPTQICIRPFVEKIPPRPISPITNMSAPTPIMRPIVITKQPTMTSSPCLSGASSPSSSTVFTPFQSKTLVGENSVIFRPCQPPSSPDITDDVKDDEELDDTKTSFDALSQSPISRERKEKIFNS